MFQGYYDKTVEFMWGIRFHNERDWFMAHKQDYIDYFLTPTKELGQEIYEGLHAAYPDEPLMLKVSRIYRDARRLHGRGPYKDHLWLCIRTGDEDWTGKPTFWFELAPEYYSYGLGFWAPKAALMETYRRNIEQHPEELGALAEQFNRQSQFVLDGPEYARSKGTVSDLLQPWYQKKGLTLRHETSPLDERIFDPALAQEITEGFKFLMPFYRYFNRITAAVPEGDLPRRR